MDNKKHILLVEDDIFLRELCEVKLKDSGFEVDTIADGAQALQKLLTKKYDLILLDIMLPTMTGFEILEAWYEQREPETSYPRVIMVTNLSDQDQVLRAKELGVIDYIVKAHYSPTQIVQKVQELI